MPDLSGAGWLRQGGRHLCLAADQLDLISPGARGANGAIHGSGWRQVAAHCVKSDAHASKHNRGMLARVRSAARAVAEASRHVRIDVEAVPEYAASLPLQE